LLENPTNNIAVEIPAAVLNVLNNVFAIIKCPMHLKVSVSYSIYYAM
jgi:hypothetical protein